MEENLQHAFSGTELSNIQPSGAENKHILTRDTSMKNDGDSINASSSLISQ
jgi:hypothetical protein